MQERNEPNLQVGEHHRYDVRVGRLQDGGMLGGREIADDFCMLLTTFAVSTARGPLWRSPRSQDERRRSPLRTWHLARRAQRSSSLLPTWPTYQAKPAVPGLASPKCAGECVGESGRVLWPRPPLIPVRQPAETVRPPPSIPS
jgi:hypothetical protein